VLPTRDHLAVLDLEDDAAIRVEALAVALSAVVMGEDRGAANLIASDAAAPGRVPRAPNYLLQGGVTLLDRA
jgi:hypothetical protein